MSKTRKLLDTPEEEQKLSLPRVLWGEVYGHLLSDEKISKEQRKALVGVTSFFQLKTDRKGSFAKRCKLFKSGIILPDDILNKSVNDLIIIIMQSDLQKIEKIKKIIHTDPDLLFCKGEIQISLDYKQFKTINVTPLQCAILVGQQDIKKVLIDYFKKNDSFNEVDRQTKELNFPAGKKILVLPGPSYFKKFNKK